jgi:serine protease Do
VTTYHTLGDPAKNDYYVWVRRKPYKVVAVERAEKVMAGDPWTDLAVLRIKAQNLIPMRLGDAEKLKKGMIVIGLGNPYAIARDGEVSATWGIVANLRRQAAPRPKTLPNQTARETLHHFGTLIQTDAKLNLGTSGGALINLRGEMIGLLTSQAALYGYEKSAGYAIPVDTMFRRTLKTLKAGKKVQVGFLGVAPEDLALAWRREGHVGALIEHVVAGTPAARAGLLGGDIITHVNQQAVENRSELFRELGQLPVRANVALRVERGTTLRRPGRSLTLRAVLSKKYVEGSRPAYAQERDPVWRGLQVDYGTA